MPNRDQDQRRSQTSTQQNDMRQAGQRNERSDLLNDMATDKNKRTQKADSSSESNWDPSDSKSRM